MRTSSSVLRSPRFVSDAHAERVRRLPTPFQLFRYVSGSEHLHFGLFEHPEQSLTEAQERNTAKLLAAIPRTASRVLDIGCGIGGTSVMLAQRGHEVLAFAPDAALIDYARAQARHASVAHRCDFRALRLQDLASDTPPFDVVLSQESLQYIHPLDEAMRRIASLTRPGGRVVIGDQVLRAPQYRAHCQFHASAEILAAAEAAGLQLVHHEDVSAAAVPTVPHSVERLRALRDEILEFFRSTHPDIERDLEVCLHNGGLEGDFYRQGLLGYEHFTWIRPA